MIEKIQKAVFILGLILIPLIFWPGILSSFETPKLLIAAVFALLTILICSIKTAIKGSLNFKLSSLDLPVLLLALIYLISALVKTPNKTEAFFVPGTAMVIILGVGYFYLANNLFSEHKKTLLISIFISGIIVSVASLLSISGILAKVPWIPTYLKSPIFSLFGGKLPEAIFLVSLLPLGIMLFNGTKEFVKKIFWSVCIGVVTLSASLSIYNMLPGKPAAFILPSFKTSWAVSIDTLKESPFLGVGPGNYLTAFGRFKPVSVNSSDTWSVRFSTSRSFILTLLTETGLLGFIIFAILLYRLYRFIKIPRETGVLFSLTLLVASMILFPLYITSVFLFFLLLSTTSTKREIVVTRLAAIALSVATLALIGGISFFGTKLVLAEYNFTKSLSAVSKNDGKLAYETIIKAIKLNPQADKYHLSLAQIDIALASSIAQNKNLKDSDKNTITQLIQEAISQAKTGVSLNPQRAGNWENLAAIYQTIMPFAQGADNYAIQSYSQAIALDPVNPNLRISLGGVYYALGRYDEAIDTFKLATLAKPDLANAHYNLAIAYREKGEIKKATEEINTVLSLVGKDTADYETAIKELKNLESLTPPQKTEASNIKPPIELPQEATPPATP